MIEKIHKYSGLLMAILVISAIAFIFGDFNRGSRGLSGGHPMMKIAGRTYNDKEFGTLGRGGLELAGMIAQRGDFGIYQFVMGISGRPTSKDDSVSNFFTGRMLVREAKEEYGVHPGDDEITAYLRGLKVFAGADGQFSAENYNLFIQRAMGPLGMTEKDLRELASDVLATTKLTSIIGSGLIPERSVVAENLALDNQQISGELAKMDLAPFQAKIEPTEEELKTYWETLKDSFTTAPKRKFTYIVVSPIAVPDPPKPAETLADAAASEDAKKAAAKKRDEEHAKLVAEAAEAKRRNQLALDTLVDDFLNNLVQQKGAGFEELAKANQWEVKTTDLFARADAPKDIDLTLRSSSGGGKSADMLFNIRETNDPFSKISEAIPVGDGQWLVARLDGEEKSRAKTFEEAREEARTQYISEKAAEKLKTTAIEAIAKIKEAMTAGKSFADAAKEIGFPDVTTFSKFTTTSRPDPATQPQSLFQAARGVDPGTIADVITEADRVFILHVTAREVVKQPDAASRIDVEIGSRARDNENRAFSSWITARTEAAKVELLYKQ